MKITVWKTGHEIADTVADFLIAGLYGRVEQIWKGHANRLEKEPIDMLNDYTHIGYGILRGMADVFHCTKHWFNVDRGYIEPGHYNGYYRISYRGTQAKWHDGIPQAEWDGKMEDWKEFDRTKPVLVCPPTEYVKGFFNAIEDDKWIAEAVKNIEAMGLTYKIRTKEMPMETAMTDVLNSCGVYTFNCSLGWKALREGIPCISDTTHSIVGSYYKHELDKKNLDYTFENIKLVDREPLFRAMKAHQFTLKEISKGEAWGLIKHYLSQ